MKREERDTQGLHGTRARPLARRYAEAEDEIAAALDALNASGHGDPEHEAALWRYAAARATLGTREMIEEAERQRPGCLAYSGARADAEAPHWYRRLVAQSSGALAARDLNAPPAAVPPAGGRARARPERDEL